MRCVDSAQKSSWEKLLVFFFFFSFFFFYNMHNDLLHCEEKIKAKFHLSKFNRKVIWVFLIDIQMELLVFWWKKQGPVKTWRGTYAQDHSHKMFSDEGEWIMLQATVCVCHAGLAQLVITWWERQLVNEQKGQWLFVMSM